MWKYYTIAILAVVVIATGTVGISFPSKPEPDLLEGLSPEQRLTACLDLDKMIKEERDLWITLYTQTLQCGPPEKFRCANRYMHSGMALDIIKMMEKTHKKHCKQA